MEADDLLCSRTRGLRRPSPGLTARLGVPMGGRVRKLRAVEDQSAPIPEEITSKFGGTYFLKGAGRLMHMLRREGGSCQVPFRARGTPTMKLWSFDARSKGQPGYSPVWR